MRTPAQILASLLRARDPGKAAVKYGLDSARQVKRFVTLAKRSDRGRVSALSYIRKRVIPAHAVKAVARIRRGVASPLGADVDKRLRRKNPDAAAVDYLQTKTQVEKQAEEDAYQTIEIHRLESMADAAFITPDFYPEEAYIEIHDMAEWDDYDGAPDTPGVSHDDGTGATQAFPGMYIPDVLSRLSRSALGPVFVVIRGVK